VVASIARLFFLAVAGLAMLVLALLRVWYRAVLAAPEVKRRKAARRLAASA
jgi:cytochrome b561